MEPSQLPLSSRSRELVKLQVQADPSQTARVLLPSQAGHPFLF